MNLYPTKSLNFNFYFKSHSTMSSFLRKSLNFHIFTQKVINFYKTQPSHFYLESHSTFTQLITQMVTQLWTFIPESHSTLIFTSTQLSHFYSESHSTYLIIFLTKICLCRISILIYLFCKISNFKLNLQLFWFVKIIFYTRYT